MDKYTEVDLTVGEMLRRSMRHWATGVAIVTSRSVDGEKRHGMTVNSFVSVSIDPPLVAVTMAHHTRTLALVQESGVFGVTILNRAQQELAEVFAGRIPEEVDRMTGLDLFTMETGSPFIQGGTAFVDCKLVHTYDMPLSTLFVAEVVAARISSDDLPPLLYYNRSFTRLGG